MPYTLVDMAGDVLALLDHLGIERVHVVGASMGGMIAQILAATAPDRVATLGVIMSTTGKAFSSPPAAAGDPAGLRCTRRGRHRRGEDSAFEVRNVAIINGPNYLPPDDELRDRVTSLASAAPIPRGMLRQFDAVLGTGSLLRYAKAVTAPTVVLHGSDDPMLRVRNGRAVAAAIPGARFVVIDGMGHDLPKPVWRPIVGALTENFATNPT